MLSDSCVVSRGYRDVQRSSTYHYSQVCQLVIYRRFDPHTFRENRYTYTKD